MKYLFVEGIHWTCWNWIWSRRLSSPGIAGSPIPSPWMPSAAKLISRVRLTASRRHEKNTRRTGSPPPMRRDWSSGSTNRSFQQNLRIIFIGSGDSRVHTRTRGRACTCMLVDTTCSQDRGSNENFLLLQQL